MLIGTARIYCFLPETYINSYYTMISVLRFGNANFLKCIFRGLWIILKLEG